MNIEFSVSELGKRYIILGDYSGSGINLEVYSNNTVRIWGHGGTPNNYTTHTVLPNEKVKVKWIRDVVNSTVDVIISGNDWSETLSRTNITFTNASTVPLRFFKDTRAMNPGVTIYKCDIQMGDKEYSFIPSIDPWNQSGFLEQKEGKFYYNENTGSGGFLTN